MYSNRAAEPVAAGDVDAARTLLRQPGVDVAAVAAGDVDAVQP